MNALKSRATGYDNSPASLPPPSFNIQDKNKLKEIGEQIKNIYLKNGTSFKDNLGYAIAVSYTIFNNLI